MKHYFKKSLAVVLSAVLLTGSIGILPDRTTATAAETTTEDAMAVFAKIKTATQAVISVKTTKVEGTTELEFPIVGKISSGFELIVDQNTGIVKSTTPVVDIGDLSSLAGGQIPTADSYTDRKSNILYSYSKELERYEIHETKPGSVGIMALISRSDPNELDKLFSFGEITTSTVDGKKLNGLPIKLKVGKDDIDKVRSDLEAIFPIVASITDMKVTDLDLVITPYYDDSFMITQTALTGTFTAEYKGSTIEAKANTKNVISLSDDLLTIPEDILKNAQLAEGFVDEVNGVKITTVIAGKDAVLSVFDVTKKNAKKLTIPASVNEYGRIYKICTAHGKAFKNAKKLKTLIVKDKDLKKMLKKNPTKYGLKKSVKIK